MCTHEETLNLLIVDFLDLSSFSSLCNGYFSQTQSLPKLNTIDLTLVSILVI